MNNTICGAQGKSILKYVDNNLEIKRGMLTFGQDVCIIIKSQNNEF